MRGIKLEDVIAAFERTAIKSFNDLCRSLELHHIAIRRGDVNPRDAVHSDLAASFHELWVGLVDPEDVSDDKAKGSSIRLDDVTRPNK